MVAILTLPGCTLLFGFGGPEADPTPCFALRGSVALAGAAGDVALSGETAFVVEDGAPGVLEAFDIRDPDDPGLLGTMNLAGGGTGILVADGRAYVVDDGGNVQIFSVADGDLTPLGATGMTPGGLGYARDVAISGDVVIVAEGWGGVTTFQVSESREAIHSAGTWDPPDGEPFAVVAKGTEVFAGVPSSGLYGVDISDPTALDSPWSVPGAGANRLVVGDSFGYGVVGISFVVFDLRAPEDPRQQPEVSLPSEECGDLAVHGDVAYLACGGDGLWRMDISNPLVPVLGEDDLGGSGSAHAVAVDGNLGAFAGERLQLFNVAGCPR